MKTLQELSGEMLPLGGSGFTARRAHLMQQDDVDAVQCALDAGRPLLLRGEPGIGKSQLALAVAVGLRRAYVSRTVDALTEPRDLLWTEDAVQRLAEAQVAGARLSGVGRKPTLQGATERVQRKHFIRPGPLWWAFDWADAERRGNDRPEQPHEECSNGNGVVVLIDEIDKADPSVPNGLLEALAERAFHTPLATGHMVRAANSPLVIITSNGERRLPAAFTRRCIVYDMKPPKDAAFVDWLVERGRGHFPEAEHPGASDALLRSAASQVLRDRKAIEAAGFRPLPGLAEYIDLLAALLTRPLRSGETYESRMRSVSRFILRKHGSDEVPHTFNEGQDP